MDEIGGLLAAVGIAKEQAGLHPDDPFEFYHGPSLPALGLFDIMRGSSFISLPEFTHPAEMDPFAEYLKYMIGHHGRPLYVLPLNYYQLYYELMNME